MKQKIVQQSKLQKNTHYRDCMGNGEWKGVRTAFIYMQTLKIVFENWKNKLNLKLTSYL